MEVDRKEIDPRDARIAQLEQQLAQTQQQVSDLIQQLGESREETRKAEKKREETKKKYNALKEEHRQYLKADMVDQDEAMEDHQLASHMHTTQATQPPPDVNRDKVCEMKKLTEGFWLDHFGLQITHGHNNYNNSRGIFVVKTAGQVRADIQPRDQLIKITWKKANQPGAVETCNLTDNIDVLRQVTQRIFNVPINVVCTVHYKRMDHAGTYISFDDTPPISV